MAKDQPRDGSLARLMAELDVVSILLFTGFLLGVMIFPMNLDRPIWAMLPIADA
jgi:hypothetical protein